MKIPDSELKIVYEVPYESFIAGALLVLSSVDSFDMKSVCEEISLSLKGFSNTANIDAFITRSSDGIITLKDNLTLDSRIEEGCTLQEKLEKIAGEKVQMAFRGFNVERYKILKKELLHAVEEIKDKAGVLLITSDGEIYKKLVEYGFKNIDYFASIIVADKYFKEHPEELKKYHLIIGGKHLASQNCNGKKREYRIELFDTLVYLNRNSDVVYISLSEVYCDKECSILAYEMILDEKRIRSKDMSFLFDEIVEYMQKNSILTKVGYKDKFEQIIPKHNKLTLPVKKSDLKILYLNFALSNEWIEESTEIAENMGLNVTFKTDNNYTLSEVRYLLGDYDIIITSHYSKNILNLGIESAEQCKETGRRLVLLATYNSSERGCYDFIDEPKGYKIELGYIYAGELADDSKTCERKINVLGDRVHENEVCLSAILSAAIEAYNEKLPTPINDLDLKSASEYDTEYQRALSKIWEKEELVSTSMEVFEQIRDTVSMYMDYRKNGLIVRESNGSRRSSNGNHFEIRRTKEGLITIKNYYQDKINFAISFFEGYSSKESKVLSIKIGDSPFEKICICSKKWKNKVKLPLASETQLRVLKAFGILISETLDPLILTAVENYDGKGQKKKV